MIIWFFLDEHFETNSRSGSEFNSENQLNLKYDSCVIIPALLQIPYLGLMRALHGNINLITF